jgi:O-glycosyl hydrolase
MNKLTTITFCCILTGIQVCLGQNSKTVERVTIDIDKTSQTIEGWGSSLCWWAAQVGNWEDSKVDSIVDLITSPNKLNMNIFRYNIGGGDDPSHLGGHMVKGKGKRAEMEGFKPSAGAPYNWNADKGQRKLMLKIKAKRPDAIFEAFSNSPPYWMTYSGCSGGNTDPLKDNLKPEFYEPFCDYLLDVCQYYKEHFGIEFRTLEPFNEPTTNYWYNLGSQEGCHFEPETQIKIIRILASKLQHSGLKTVISASDETNIASCIKVLKAYQSAGDILDKIGQINTHTYSGTNAERIEADALVTSVGKPFWQSETGPSGNSKTSLESNLSLAQKLFDDMRYMKPKAWLDWQLMEEKNETWCLMRCNFTTQAYKIVKNFYVRMQITRFFGQGYQLVETNNDEVLAALNPDKTELVVALLNTAGQPKSFDLKIETVAQMKTQVSAFRTSATENCTKIGEVKLKNGSIGYTTPAQSLTTFAIALNN